MSACPQIDNFDSSITVINDRWKNPGRNYRAASTD